MRSMAWVVAATLVVSLAAGAGENAVPLTRVTSFSSGVAYFEHNGKVSGDAEIQLRFKTDQINDMLKSLVALDLGGGTVSGVDYASREPLARALKSFGVDISGEPTLGQLLKQIRGADVVIATPEKITGKILGVETRTRQILPSNTVIQQEFLDLVTADGIKSIALDTVASITLADPKLNTELGKALALLVESRDVDSKPVRIAFTGKGERPVRIGYINEAPIWRTSYRLVLGEEKKEEAAMQGWAIVENTSDFDWEKIELTLVSGRPISFIMDLYTPLYVPRPVVQPELYASLRPQEYDEGLKADRTILALQAQGGEGGGGGQMRGRGEARRSVAANRQLAAAAPGAPPAAMALAEAEGDMATNAASEQALRQGVAAMATGKAVGELFSYRIKSPVTLPRRKSAMLPIVNQTVKARKVSIYNASVLATNPLNGFWLTNDTGLSLLAGPVTIFDGGTYAGDARINNLAPNDKRLLSYAIDLKVTVDPTANTSQQIVAAKIVRGVLQCTRRHEFKQEYLIKNKAEQERVVLIEYPFVADRKLIEPAEPLEKTPQVQRFETKVPAATTGKFVVREEQTLTQTIALLPTDVGQLQFYAQTGEIPPKVREAVAEVIKRKNALVEAERQLNESQQRIGQLRQEQGAIRSNMGAVGHGTQSFQRFEKKLLDLETQIEETQKQVEAKRTQVNTLRTDLEQQLDKMNVE